MSDYFYSILILESLLNPIIVDTKSGIILGMGDCAELLKKLFDETQEKYPNNKVLVISFNKI